jgi:hypothetical protein
MLTGPPPKFYGTRDILETHGVALTVDITEVCGSLNRAIAVLYTARAPGVGNAPASSGLWL